MRSEFDVLTSSDSRIASLVPGLKEIRRRTYRSTFGKAHPIFNSEDDAVLILWKPGKYHQVYFMFASQLSIHHEPFSVEHWSLNVYRRK